MTIKLDVIQTVGLAVLVFLLGSSIKKRVSFFQKQSRPDAGKQDIEAGHPNDPVQERIGPDNSS